MARPRKLPAGTTAADRARAHEAAALAAGGGRLVVLLSPEARAALDQLTEGGETRKTVVERLLTEAASRC